MKAGHVFCNGKIDPHKPSPSFRQIVANVTLKWVFLTGIMLIPSHFPAHAQEMPPIQSYTPADYRAENQNWMISQGPDKIIYAANSEGLLEFNGSGWKLYPSPNNTIMRSIFVQNDRVYTGCFMEFGYWQKNDRGLLVYHSISQHLSIKLLEEENFWDIVGLDEWVLFRSNNRIYFYNTRDDSVKVIETEEDILQFTVIHEKLYYFVSGQGVYTVEEGNPHLLIPDSLLKNDRVIRVFPTEKGILLLTKENGFYMFEDRILTRWMIPADRLLGQVTINCAIGLSEGNFALGTISNGLVLLSENGELLYHIRKVDGLNNNTLLSLFEDKDRNVWAGLDNGISCINLPSPIRIFSSYQGSIGTVYTSILHNGYLYLGTNQGLYCKKYGSSLPFQYIENTSGQVYNLSEIDGEVFCGHHLGTYLVTGNKAKKICNVRGTWKFQKMPGHPNMLLQGNYTGIYVLSRENGGWELRNKLEGFDHSARYFDLDENQCIWVNHEYQGIYKLVPDSSFHRLKEVSLISDIPNGKNSGLVEYRGQIIYCYRDGIYTLDETKGQFVRDSLLSHVFTNDEYVSGKMVVDSENNLWAFTKYNIVRISRGQLSGKPEILRIPVSSHMRRAMSGYENITHLAGNVYLMGTVDGYMRIDISGFNNREYDINLNSVFLKSRDNAIQYSKLKSPGKFNHRQNIIGFEFSVPSYDKYCPLEYQYRLKGLNDNWSAWSSENTRLFENLSHGEYLFQARARVGNKLTENTIQYAFKIGKPWHITHLAIAGYILIGLFIILLSNAIYARNYKRKKNRELELSKKEYELNHLEAQQQLVMMKNEQLRKDVESKNRELFISTMSIVRKNELLGAINKGLEKSAGSPDIKPILQLINKNLNSEKDWQIFEEAFNNADQGFLQKVIKKHPDLTHNDLRLCAYLRLNLSTKEIAPLLNISVKSAEIKRYRLRKKMNLPHGKSLVEYILEI